MKSVLFLFLVFGFSNVIADDKSETCKQDKGVEEKKVCPAKIKLTTKRSSIEAQRIRLNISRVDTNRIANFNPAQLNAVNARSGGMGNGGDALICGDRVILLDSAEAHKMKLIMDLDNPNVANPTWRSMVNVAVKRLSKIDEVTATKLYDYSMEMVNDFEKFQMYPDSRGKYVYLGYDILAEINDSHPVSTPEGCEEHPRQLVSQRVPKYIREYRYEFSKSLWEKMDLQEQSMTILHEAWYRIMLENGAENSRAARYMNGLIASVDFEDVSFFEYIETLKNTELTKYVVQNVSEALKEKEITFDLKEHIIKPENDMMCAPNFKLNPNIKKTYSIIRRGQKYLKNVKFQKVCFKNSKLTKIVMPTSIPNKGRTLRLPFHQVEFEAASSDEPTMNFSDTGKLLSLTGIKFKTLMRMFYVCDGDDSFTDNIGCEKGPFIDHDTKVSNPDQILFDNNEKPIYDF